jgi:hypothetical protein
MSKDVMVQLPEEVLDKIVLDSLQDSYFLCKEWLRERKRNPEFMAIYHTKQQKDILEILRRIEAFETVLEFYGVSDPNYVGE